uniref:Protein RFT1 homolog n=1 Tax=Tabanus bromius TaxID=304241 RepID=A0A0K8TT16_TABBR
MGRNVLKSSLQSAYFNIVFQIMCRCITFGINAFIVRKVGRHVLGIMNVRLLLLESTILFLSREAITRAALSSTTLKSSKCSWPQLINQMWLTVPICCFLCLPCLYIWLNILSPVEEDLYAQYKFGCWSIAISCVIELCSEAPFFVSQVFCFVKLRVILDTLHVFLRSVVFIFIVLSNKDIAIIAFGVAQLASAFTIIFGRYSFFHFYINKFREYKKGFKEGQATKNNDYFKNMEDFPFNSIKEMVPGFLPNEGPLLNSELQILTLSFIKQGVLKQILTEGEKYVMSVSPVLSFSEQATYDVVNNLGSLAARFIFRPIEDSSYFYFTQTIARDEKLEKQDKNKVLEAGEVLQTVCRLVSTIGYVAFAFGQSYAGILLLFYGGSDFVAGGLPETLLRWHSLAICFLAVNGITEGYMFATNTSREIDTYNYFMAIFSVMFLLLSFILTSILGPVGFILANCTNMFCRIYYSTKYIHKQYKPLGMNPLKGLIPDVYFFVTLVTMGGICKFSQAKILEYSAFYHILIGFMCTIITLVVWAVENKALIKRGFSKYGNKIKSH